MKVQVTPKGIRVRVSQSEFVRLEREPVILDCGGWVFRLQADPAGLTHLLGWPFHTVLTIGFKDMQDWKLEPENGIVLAGMQPPCELDVDYKTKHTQ